MIPVIALVGRPNVGKSALFNRLAGKRIAVVHDLPGVTRDRHYARSLVHGRPVTIVDTGGLDPTTDDPLNPNVIAQAELAIGEAQAIVCVMDGTLGATSADRDVVNLLRRSGKPVIYVANKADNQGRAAAAADLHELGLGSFIPVSALHGLGIAELERALAEALEPIPREAPQADVDPNKPRLAIVGRPNAGKSSLFNRLCGTERSLVSDIPGTTRDSIDTTIDFKGQPYVIVDTAGIRRRARVKKGIEAACVIQALQCIPRAEVVILMCDGSEEVAEQDARLFGLCVERRRGLVLVVNKMDLLSKEQQKAAEQQARDILHFAPWAPIVRISATTGQGVSNLMRVVGTVSREFHRRVSTGALNRFFQEALSRHSPPARGGRSPRLYYITQAETAPPTFIAMCSAPANIDQSYRRFVTNQIRKTFGFDGAPVTVRFRRRERSASHNSA